MPLRDRRIVERHGGSVNRQIERRQLERRSENGFDSAMALDA